MSAGGNDRVFGGAGNDRVFGEEGNDYPYGDNGRDEPRITAEDNDKLYGVPVMTASLLVMAGIF
ncbi:hypothetical protein [Mesorhizobium sp. ORS 3428]|uniref:hypothetical protein n=1 Tax=Mesorhizobium sp. ORS 3428 TaxID=540997 RepID=UPI003083D717